jgi:hypothetical protein
MDLSKKKSDHDVGIYTRNYVNPVNFVILRIKRCKGKDLPQR